MKYPTTYPVLDKPIEEIEKDIKAFTEAQEEMSANKAEELIEQDNAKIDGTTDEIKPETI